jgi:CMP-N-acetylneuraminic acid synthetase
MTVRVVAIVPMRHESERVRGKNYRQFGGKPLFHHIVETLRACPLVSETVIDTDSELIREDALRAFPGLIVIDRPEHLRGGNVAMNDVLLNDVRQIDADVYLQTHSTNPLLRVQTVRDAIDSFVGQRERFDSLFSVTRLQTRLWTGDGKPMNHDPAVLLRTQDLPPTYEENSCLYLFSRAGLERIGTRIGERPILFEIPPEEAWDIDEELDFEVAEFLYLRRARAGA